MSIQDLEAQAFKDFPFLKGSVVIVTRPLQLSAYGGDLIGLIEEKCPEAFKTHGIFGTDEELCGLVNNRIAQGERFVCRIAMSALDDNRPDMPLYLISAADLRDRPDSLHRVCAEESGINAACFTDVPEDFRDRFETWHFDESLGEILYNLARDPDGKDDPQIEIANNPLAFGALYASFRHRQRFGAAATPILSLMRDVCSLGLVNGSHICVQAAAAIDAGSTLGDLCPVDNAYAAYEYCRDAFAKKIVLHGRDLIDRLFAARDKGICEIAFERVSDALESMQTLLPHQYDRYVQALKTRTLYDESRRLSSNAILSLRPALSEEQEEKLDGIMNEVGEYCALRDAGEHLRLAGAQAVREHLRSEFMFMATARVAAFAKNFPEALRKLEARLIEKADRIMPGCGASLIDIMKKIHDSPVPEGLSAADAAYGDEAVVAFEALSQESRRIIDGCRLEEARMAVARMEGETTPVSPSFTLPRIFVTNSLQ